MKVLPVPLGAALLGAVLLTGCSAGVTAEQAPTVASGASFHGTEPVSPGTRPSFVLEDTEGRPYDFAVETGGRPTLLYFGYANCPDECPTAMADIAAALRTTPAALREDTVVVLVTTDPDRDTGPVLRRFLDQFSTDFVGLRGTQAQVDAAQTATGVSPAQKGEDVPTLPGRPDQHEHAPGTAAHQHFGPLGYGVGHADVIFAFDSDDRLPVLYDGGVRPSDIAADLPLLASGETP
ncbi:MAG: electron transport protein SCO1/SenC [Frankiales bacterium]|nr:electron transport protein SCO1/SenC [Frankiales bacterium]